MANNSILEGKKVLIVDDEPDVLKTLEDVLDMCDIDAASDHETAKQLLNSNYYDIVVLDIMGVNGYGLLAAANKKNIPTVMLTAHALNPENFAKSMNDGACAYLPKHKLSEINLFLSDVLEEGCKKSRMLGKWFERLKDYYENKFGPGWLDEYKGSWL
ncbi:MAG: response regulator [Deltaproteobacteria bacterium]|jgi:DNA-binding NtrC family response regulator|nr:response regulator [Deltaproteobacteria bacterium]